MVRIDLETRKKILHTWCTEKGVTYNQIAKRFKVHHTSVKNIIDKYGNESSLKDLPRSGRKPGSSKPQLDAKVVTHIKRNRSVSTRDLAKKFKTSIGMIQRIKARNSLKTYKKRKVPKKSVEQQSRAKTRARKLYERILENSNRCILMDDETYVKQDSRALPGPQFYTKSTDEEVDDADCTIAMEKFGQKVLVWQAICTCGLRSSIFFTKGTINAQIYKDECLAKRLRHLYKKNQSSPLFWPDLASVHYAKPVLQWLSDNNIQFVEKNINPPNCPDLRPIERYWAIVKRIFRKEGTVSQTMEEFEKNWKAASRKCTKATVQNLMEGISSKVRSFFRT
jgi:transposase